VTEEYKYTTSATKRAAMLLPLDRGKAVALLLCRMQGIGPRNEGPMAEEHSTRNAAISPNKAKSRAEKDFKRMLTRNDVSIL